MIYMEKIIIISLTLFVAACVTSTPVHYLSLDDGQATPLGSPSGLRVAITQVNLPEVIDRPQLVIQTASYQLQIDEQYEWAEPLRAQVPRVFARYLGEALDSSRVIALAIDVQNFDLDFKVMLNIQRFNVIAKQEVELDVLWRVEAQNGSSFVGRSLIREVIETTGSSDYTNALAAKNRALQATANQVASEITDKLKETTSTD